MDWFHSPIHWYALGFGGQILFGSRFIVQWWASERTQRVVIPLAFWYLSLFGGVLLLAYSIHKRDPVFAVGQAAGVLIYVRNLMLHSKSRNAIEPSSETVSPS